MNRDHTILHVDDDPAFLRLVRHKLQNLGYNVVSVDDPSTALNTMLATGARVIILDIDMPKVDGITLLRQFKTYDGGLQVIMLTGLVSMTTVMQTMIGGAEACVFKPITEFDSLLSVVEASFVKIDRWWDALHDRRRRKQDEQESAVTPA